MTCKAATKNPHVPAMRQRSKKFRDRRKRRSKEKSKELDDYDPKIIITYKGAKYTLA